MGRKRFLFFMSNLLLSIILISCKMRLTHFQGDEEMVFVPGGEFVMGTDAVDEENRAKMYGIPKPWYEDETPERRLYVNSFYIDTFEVTNKQYNQFISSTGYPPPLDWE